MFYCLLQNIWMQATALGIPWTRLTISVYLWSISIVPLLHYISMIMQAILLFTARALGSTAVSMQLSVTQSVGRNKYKEIHLIFDITLDLFSQEVCCLWGPRSEMFTETVPSLVKPTDYYPLLECLVGASEIYIEQQSGKH